MKARGIKNGLQDKAAKNKLLLKRQLQRDRLITRARYVVERTFGSQTQCGSMPTKYCVTVAWPRRTPVAAINKFSRISSQHLEILTHLLLNDESLKIGFQQPNA